jgi:RNA polymerase sigma-70 factor (ECF subfamily)
MRATTIAVTEGRRRTWAEFETLVEPRVDGLFRLAAAIVGPDDARDVTQDALVRAWHGFGGLRSPDALDAWLRAIVVNGCRNVLRSRRRSVRSIPVESAAEVAAPGAPMGDALAERDRLDRAFDQLSADHRSILALRFSLDLPLREVAATLDIPEGTAKSRLHAATARLRDLLRET